MAAIALQSLPLGFRFHPKDEELVNHYLKNKITGRIKSEVEVIPEIDVCKCEPWELPAKSLIKSEDPEWFFFAPKDRKYPSGHRSNRATKHGYWKATGRDRMIRSSGGKGLLIGMKKTLVFHEGRAPKGARTHWIMHEYRTTEPEFDQGNYVLYRLFNKKSEEKSPSSKTDDLKIHDFSPDGMQNGADGVEEIEIQSNHESPKSDLQEEPIQSPGSAKKQPAGIEMWLADKGQCSTRATVKPETDRRNMALPHEETKLGEMADPLQDVSFQLCDGVDEQVGHGFSNISSPMLQIQDNPWSSGMNQESHIGSNPFDNVDYLSAFLNSILDSDDRSSGACPKESPAESLVKQAPPWDSASCKDSGSNSELEIEPCLTQCATSQRFHGSSLGSSDLLPVDGSSLYPESATQLSTLYENTDLFPSGIAGPDIYSVEAGESMDELFKSIEEFNNPSKMSVTTEEDFEMPGINIRSSQSNHEPPSSNSFFKQGIARRRLCLQGSIRMVPSNGANVESNHMVDDEDKNSIPKATQTLSDSFEESSSDKNITDELDESMEIGIKTRDRGVQHSPNALSPQDKLSSYKILLQSTSDSESQVGDDDKEEVENIEQHAGDPLDDNISESKENSLPTSPNKLEEFSIHDADETTSSSSNHQNPEPMMRPRKKSANECDKSVKQSSNSMGLMNHSVVAHMSYLVLSVVVLLLASGIYRLTISTVE
ncbi:uncharacterized protein LOC141818922 isoform X3 [Curcuma longa]|uniref:uncharacterized protein LOC141818922 isoform X3 n=1 Tax=Curcuma longa TaxID=136217 RepID=UPI003D9DF8EC